ncbi:hypothetical protein SELMODRAFT_132639 [Selaginella moellendorffii]|uniref:Pentacotripeptide-repeat region of PRORP domain-containing protein n=2 Tax=Selaginella moellendorffii TaxID=88036 RepID=D8T5V5_SELML|nr:hypothetical protein SELMODRAFT_132639 [Selaginella moellendorffii]
MFYSLPLRNEHSWNAYVAAFARVGDIERAKSAFDQIPEQDQISWSVLLAAQAHFGDSTLAIATFDEMRVSVAPEEACFALVLTSCSRKGKLYNGRCCFTSMRYDFGVSPSRPHYCCMIDLLARSGHLEDCEKLILTMPFEPQVLEWIALLSACSSHGDNERGARAAKSLTRFQHGAAYVLLANANIPKLTGTK